MAKRKRIKCLIETKFIPIPHAIRGQESRGRFLLPHLNLLHPMIVCVCLSLCVCVFVYVCVCVYIYICVCAYMPIQQAHRPGDCLRDVWAGRDAWICVGSSGCFSDLSDCGESGKWHLVIHQCAKLRGDGVLCDDNATLISQATPSGNLEHCEPC